MNSEKYFSTAHIYSLYAEKLLEDAQAIMHMWNMIMGVHTAEVLSQAYAYERARAQNLSQESARLNSMARILRAAGAIQESIEDIKDLPGDIIRSLSTAVDQECAAHIHALDSQQLPTESPIHAVEAIMDTYPDAHILFHQNNHIAFAFGDIESSDTILTIVAGVGSSNSAEWMRYAQRAHSVHNAINSNSIKNSATIMWLGYDAPASIGRAISTCPARRGAHNLERFQKELIKQTPKQKHIILAHSYGSVTAAHAMKKKDQEKIADAFIIIGSPGVGVDHAHSLSIPVLAAMASRDLIQWSARIHGRPPTHESFGAIKIPAQGNHSDYFEDPVFLENLRKEINRVYAHDEAATLQQQ